MVLGLGISIAKGGLPPLFVPSDIPGLVGWWDPNDADNYTLISDEYEQLLDKSGQGNTINAHNSGTRADQGTLNGLSTLRFVGSNELMKTAAKLTGLTDDFSVVCVLKVDDFVAKTQQAPWSYEGSDNTPVFHPRLETPDQMRFMARADGGGAKDTGAWTNEFTGTEKVLTVTMDLDNEFDSWTNGVHAAGATLPKDVSGWAWTEEDRFRLGGGIWASSFDGWVGDVLVYDHVLTAVERLLVEAWIVDKWSIPM